MIKHFAERNALKALVLASAALPAAAYAQDATDAAPENDGLEMIVVTAQKRSESLQDVGISVTAISGERLRETGISDTVDIIKLTPGFNILSSSRSNTNVSVRGVSQNDFADHLEGPIAVYQDEGYLGSSGAINGQGYDLERVEVLRGPQGTLFGRNATGGLVHYISAAPTENFESYGQLDVGERGLVQFEGAVSGPLSENTRARLSLATQQEDGYVKNLIGRDPGNKNNYSGRLQIVTDLSPATQLRLMVNGNVNSNERGNAGQNVPAIPDANGQGRRLGDNEIGTWPNIILGGTITSSCGGCDIYGYKTPSDPFVQRLSSPGIFEKTLLHAQAKLTTKIGSDINVTSITDYLSLDKKLLGTDTDGSPTDGFHFNVEQKYRQISQEIRLDGQAGPLKWLAGAYFLNINGDYSVYADFDVSVYVGAPVCNITPGVSCPTPVPGVLGRSRTDHSLDVHSFSAFAQLEYEVTPTISIIGGLRYTHDDKEANYQWNTNALPNFPTTFYNESIDPSAHRRFNLVSAKAEIDWKPNKDVLVYASYSRGTKGGNWSQPVFPPPITSAQFPIFPHDPEVLNDFELGLKTEFWDRKARFNIGTFYYIYNNYQAFSLAGLSQSIFNKDAKAWGGEAELELAPTQGLTLSLGMATMWSRVYDMQYTTGALYTSQLPFSSKWTFNGLARYEWDALDGKLAVQGNFRSVGPHYFSVANEPFVYEKRNFVADARVSYTTGEGRWNLSAWVKNLTDDKYRTFALDISALSYGNQNFGPPRQFGATIGWRY